MTGGAGFVGSHLIEALVRDPVNRVLSLDNYSTGSESNHVEGAEYRRTCTQAETADGRRKVFIYQLANAPNPA